MTGICKDIFKAIHEGKWLSIEYRNKEQNVTKYWIAIKALDVRNRILLVEGLHLAFYSCRQLNIYIDSILSSSVLDGTYCPVNPKLVTDIREHPETYQSIFGHTANLKILHYLADCNRLDATPYRCEYTLIEALDGSRLEDTVFHLSDPQFKQLVSYFQQKRPHSAAARLQKLRWLSLNILSIHHPKGLYVLASRKLELDVVHKSLRPADNITICREFTIDGEKQSIRKFLDAEDLLLLDNLESNLEIVKDRIMLHSPYESIVDDNPYILTLGQDVLLDLNQEYAAITELYAKGSPSVPIKAFFGDLTRRPERRKEYPLALINKKVNIDQLLAVHNAVKYPVTYIQGPPGTGKTNTITNTIVTAFFNERTILFTSYNNHPIDSVFTGLRKMCYKGKPIPFPVIRLGNNEKLADALQDIRNLYQATKDIPIFDGTLNRNREDKIENTRQLTALLKRHEEILELQERKEIMEELLQNRNNLTFQVGLQGRQYQQVTRRLQELGQVTDEEALALITDDESEFLKYLYYVSAKHIQRIQEPKNQDLLDLILMTGDPEECVAAFNQYLKKEENLKKLLRIFPVVITTCISAHKLADPKPYFDMVIIDEASQCNLATSLIPILRGHNLMLVGDPQQLNPVILLDPKDNAILKQRYGISKEYDYIENSIYKTYLACDAVSDEILLHYHYRCHKKIIEFNNQKYYNNKLDIRSQVETETPLVFVEIPENTTGLKNTAPSEVNYILQFAREHKEKNIGIITPFARQKELIESCLRQASLSNLSCGTVHAFQGDEKDIILFSLALTDQTHLRTYDWLKNNRELVNVATSRAKEQLVILGNTQNLERLHRNLPEDDIFELVEYVKSNGISKVTPKATVSRALGIKPYSTETEEAFLQSLQHALNTILLDQKRYVVHKEVAISHVFAENSAAMDLFYSGRFDFVIYEKEGRREFPVLAIELDGKEHFENEIVKQRDRKKQAICQEHNFLLIRIENSYARRYQYIKDILIDYFQN